MTEKVYDIIVIGSGSGGLTIGLFMSKAGFKVLMLSSIRFTPTLLPHESTNNLLQNTKKKASHKQLKNYYKRLTKFSVNGMVGNI